MRKSPNLQRIRYNIWTFCGFLHLTELVELAISHPPRWSPTPWHLALPTTRGRLQVSPTEAGPGRSLERSPEISHLAPRGKSEASARAGPAILPALRLRHPARSDHPPEPSHGYQVRYGRRGGAVPQPARCPVRLFPGSPRSPRSA